MIVLTDEEWDAQRADLLPRFSTLLSDTQSSSDLADELTALIKEYPTSASTEALANSIIDVVQCKPAAIDTILPAIISFLPTFESTQIDWAGNEGTWSTVFTIDFLDLLDTVIFERQLYHTPRTTVEPANLTLTCALLSGAMVKHGFLIPGTHIPHRFANMALRLQEKKQRAEVYVVGLCLQLDAAGVTFLGQLETEYGYRVEKIIEILRKFEREEYVAHPVGIELLKETIKDVETSFPNTYSAGEVWGKVFPV